MTPVADGRRPLADLINWDTFPAPPGRRPHQRRFAAATEIQVLLRDDATLSMHGRRPGGIGCYQPVPRAEPYACQHEVTICLSCRRQWEQDHFLAVFTHGTATAYRNEGCRCTVCGPAEADRYTVTRVLESRPTELPAEEVNQAPESG